MIVKIAEDKNASLTFSEGMMKVTMMDSELNVKWFREHDFVGEMLLGPNTWGGFPHNNELVDWRVLCHSNNRIINVKFFRHLLNPLGVLRIYVY